MSLDLSNNTMWKLPSWMERLYSDNEIEEMQEVSGPVLLLPLEGRHFVWGLSKNLVGLTERSYGVAGQSCQLFEWFLATYFRQMSQMVPRGSEWRRTKQELTNKTVLLLAVCIQLVTKMSSVNDYISAQRLRNILLEYDLPYSLKEINTAEAKVFKTIGFRIPLWTNVEKACMLADKVGMHDTLVETVTIMTEITEQYLIDIQTEIRSIASGTPSSSTSRDSSAGPASYNRWSVGNIRSMHMVAGVVAATGLYMEFSGPDPVPRLAFYTRSPVAYITCIRNVVLNKVIELRDNCTVVKRPSDSHPETPKSKRKRRC